MRKYRSGGLFFKSGSTVEYLKKTNFLYIFLGWNIFVVFLYRWYVHKYIEDKETWAKMSASQKYLYFMMKPEDKLSVVTFKGLHHVDTKTVSADAYLKVLSDPDSEKPESNIMSSTDNTDEF